MAYQLPPRILDWALLPSGLSHQPTGESQAPGLLFTIQIAGCTPRVPDSVDLGVGPENLHF